MNLTLAAANTVEIEEIIIALAQNGFDPSVSHAEAIRERLDVNAITAAANRSLSLRTAIQATLLGTATGQSVPMIDLAGDKLIVYANGAHELPDYVGVARDRRTNHLVLTTLQTGIRDIAFLEAKTVARAIPEAQALMPKLLETEWVYYAPSTHSVIDEVRPDGLTIWGRKTYGQIVSEYPDVVKIPFDRALALNDAKYLDEPTKRITEDDWDDALNVLPPMKWNRYTEFETFMMSECITGDITRVYARIGDDYVRFNGRTSMTHFEIVTRARAYLAPALEASMPEASTLEAAA